MIVPVAATTLQPRGAGVMRDETNREFLDYFTPRSQNAPKSPPGTGTWGCLGWLIALVVCSGVSWGLTALYVMWCWETFGLFGPVSGQARTVLGVGFYAIVLSPF